MIRLGQILLVAALSPGCASQPPRVAGIEVAPGATFDLLPPAALGRSVALEQLVEARYGDKSFTFHCLLEVDAEQLVLVGMTPFNTRAFALTLKGGELAVDLTPGIDLPADPSRILADLQLALWPAPKVQGLELSTWTGFGGPAGGDWGREFARNGSKVIRVSYGPNVRVGGELWGELLVLEHFEQNYTLTVHTVRAEKLSP